MQLTAFCLQLCSFKTANSSDHWLTERVARLSSEFSSLSSERTRRLFTLISAWIKKISLISIRFRRFLKIVSMHCLNGRCRTFLALRCPHSLLFLTWVMACCRRTLPYVRASYSRHIFSASLSRQFSWIYMMFQFYIAFVITWYADFVNLNYHINIIWCWTLIKVVLRGCRRNRCLSLSLKVSNSSSV